MRCFLLYVLQKPLLMTVCRSSQPYVPKMVAVVPKQALLSGPRPPFFSVLLYLFRGWKNTPQVFNSFCPLLRQSFRCICTGFR